MIDQIVSRSGCSRSVALKRLAKYRTGRIDEAKMYAPPSKRGRGRR